MAVCDDGYILIAEFAGDFEGLVEAERNPNRHAPSLGRVVAEVLGQNGGRRIGRTESSLWYRLDGDMCRVVEAVRGIYSRFSELIEAAKRWKADEGVAQYGF